MRTVVAPSLLLVLTSFIALHGTERFVAPDGVAGNAGTRASPWDIASALDGTQKLAAGDTVWLLAGTYKRRPDEQFVIHLIGDAKHTIQVRGETGQRVTIDGGLKVEDPSAHVWIRDLELLVSEPHPTTPQPPGSNPPEFTRPWGGLHVYGGHHCKFINLVIHDCRQGVSWWKGSLDSDLYGCVIYGNGWPGTDRGHGHCIYTQNKDGTKLISNCILTAQLSGQQTLQAYGSKNADVDNFLCEDNVAYGMGLFLIGGGRPSHNIRVRRNHLYQVGMQLGYDAPFNVDCDLTDNRIFRGTLTIQNYQTVTQERTWIFKESEKPTKTESFVMPNAYETGRAHVVVYNWSGEPETVAEVGAVLSDGDSYVLLDPRKMYGAAVQSGTVKDGKVRIPTPGEFTVQVLRRR